MEGTTPDAVVEGEVEFLPDYGEDQRRDSVRIDVELGNSAAGSTTKSGVGRPLGGAAPSHRRPCRPAWTAWPRPSGYSARPWAIRPRRPSATHPSTQKEGRWQAEPGAGTRSREQLTAADRRHSATVGLRYGRCRRAEALMRSYLSGHASQHAPVGQDRTEAPGRHAHLAVGAFPRPSAEPGWASRRRWTAPRRPSWRGGSRCGGVRPLAAGGRRGAAAAPRPGRAGGTGGVSPAGRDAQRGESLAIRLRPI